MPPTSKDVLRQFVEPEQGIVLWKGLFMAMLYAMVFTWLGLALGRWMKKLQR
jgi:hypothetical protein